MAQLLSEQIEKELTEVFKELKRKVDLVFFTQKIACKGCVSQRELLDSLVKLSPKLNLKIYDLEEDAEYATQLKVTKVPCTCVMGEEDYGIKFYGLTGGYEFSSLIESIKMVSLQESNLNPELETMALMITAPTHIEVMVTLSCPYCTRMVHLAHQLALINPKITSDMVESSEFPDMVQKYGVQGVPKTIINYNKKWSFDGALPALNAILEILKFSNPQVYEKIEDQIRAAQGFLAKEGVDEEHLYEVLIVGAGPAAMTAAIYAARKNMDVALIGEHPGGQVTNTATIENWPGLSSVGGDELAQLFKDHAEHYPIAEKVSETIQKIRKIPQGFELLSKSGEVYRAKTVIYCAGKEYRRLGVPGEEKFIGNGVAFCATCDAPLFKGKRVAVIGGGNSAFTAVRDLATYAREIYLINNTDQYNADPSLISEIKQYQQVQYYNLASVEEFRGEERLEGIRLRVGKEYIDLPVSGAFLEIGLIPNTEPVRELLKVNDKGEIPVDRNQYTELPGFFAAGDVTDEEEKQIVVAAGTGAKAALSAYQYLTTSGKSANWK